MKTKAIAALGIDTESHVGIYGIVVADSGMYYKKWAGSASLPSETGWLALGGRFNSTPSAFRAPLRIFPGGRQRCLASAPMTRCFIVQWSLPPGRLRQKGWGPLGGIFTSPSAAISFGPEGFFMRAIVGLGTDNQPYLKIFDFAGNGVWLPSASDWLPLGGVLIYEPAVPNRSQDESTSFDIFGVGEDRQMYHMIVDGAQWPPKTSGWQPVGGCFQEPSGRGEVGPRACRRLRARHGSCKVPSGLRKRQLAQRLGIPGRCVR